MTTFVFSDTWDDISSFYNWAAENREERFSAEFVLDERTQSLNMHVKVDDDLTALRIKMEFAEKIHRTIK